MTKSKLAAVMNYDQVIPKCTTLSLIDDGKEFTGLRIRKLDFGASLELIKYITHWAQNQSAEEAYHAAHEHEETPDTFIMDLFEEMRSFTPDLTVNFIDSYIDWVIDAIRGDYMYGGGDLFEDLILRWCNCSSSDSKSPTKMYRIFANYILHQQDGDFDPKLGSSIGDVIKEIVQSWKKEVWRTKDFSILPQNIAAQDFNDYCRYHSHGDSHTCYRNL